MYRRRPRLQRPLRRRFIEQQNSEELCDRLIQVDEDQRAGKLNGEDDSGYRRDHFVADGVYVVNASLISQAGQFVTGWLRAAVQLRARTHQRSFYDSQ